MITKVCQGQIARDKSFLQAHSRQVFQTHLQTDRSFRTPIYNHRLGQEIGYILQVHIRISLDIQEHIAHQVVHLTRCA